MKELKIDGVEHPIRPLTFKGLRERSADIKGMVQGQWETPEALFAAMVRIVQASLQRSAPDLTFEQIEASLEWGTAHAAVETILTISFPPSAPGETKVGSPSGHSTGTAPSPN